ncbi:MAG: hypothetical protein JO256_07710 [Alphaproteobacteria bacterium]|nr:hypothetical protein [Alphaproteobacteria bacterium]
MRKLRAAALAALLGTSILGAGQALAQEISAAVGNPLTQAKALAKSGNYRAAMQQADAASAAAKTATERQIVDQTKQYIAIEAGKAGDTSVGGAQGAKAKIAVDAAAGRWKEVIADGEALSKTGGLDATYSLVVAQAYYQLHDPKNCKNYIRSHGLGGETALQTLQRCAYDDNDDATQRQALEQLVGSTGKAEYWKDLLHLSERAKGISDHSTLDIYRLKSMTGTLAGGDDVMTYALLAMQLKMAAEAKTAVEKGMADKTLPPGDRTTRLLKQATDRANAAAASFAKDMADAQKQPQGDALVVLGEDQIGQGKAKEALATIQAGIAKGCKDAANCQIRLGTAYLATGDKANAGKTFNAVKGDEKLVMVAHLYSLYARSGAAAAPAEAPAKGKKGAKAKK